MISRANMRTGAFSAAAAVVALVLTQFIFEDGTPIAILFQGSVNGLLNALLAVSIVFIFRSHRIINFAAAALGATGSVFTYNLVVFNEWPFLLAFVVGVVVSAGLGAAFEITFVRRFFNAPRLVLTVVTIGLISALGFATGFVNNLPLFTTGSDRTLEELAGAAIVLPFADFDFVLGDLELFFGFKDLFAIAIALITFAGLAYFLKRSKFGVAMRASAENAERAALLGISVGSISQLAWIIAATLGGISVILSNTVNAQFGGGTASPELLIIALAAAVFGRMRNLPLTAFSAVVITILKESYDFAYKEAGGLVFVGLFIILLGSLVLYGLSKKQTRSEAREASSWKATDEARPTPKELLEIPGIRRTRRFLIIVGLLAVAIFPFVVDTRQANLAGYYAILTIGLLSLTVLTGWAGQVSLGQAAFIAIGAVVGGKLSPAITFYGALFLVPVITAAISLLIGIPSLRIPGLLLGVATYAMSFAVTGVLFEEKYFGWLLPTNVSRPSLLVIDFEDERSMYYLSMAALLLAILVVYGLRKTRPGRTLIGLRDNENNLRSFGIAPVRMKLAAFAISGYLCGYCGVLLAHHQRAAQVETFPVALSLDLFLYAVVGGVGSIFGVVAGGLFYAAKDLITGQLLTFVIGPIGVVLLLYMAPGGLASLILGARDGVLRIVAQRKQLLVPSLFADFDPTALLRRLIPLSEAQSGSGLAAVPTDARYVKSSVLYGLKGRVIAGEAQRPADEGVAIGRAAKGIESVEPREAEGLES